MAKEVIPPEERYLHLGKISKPHGIRGEVKIFSFSEQPENMLQYKTLVIVDKQGQQRRVSVSKCRIQGKTAVVKLKDIDNRNQAEELQGMEVLLDKQELPATGKREYYWFQLQGLTVETRQGEKLGKVTNIFSNGAQDILVIGDKHAEYLVPILQGIILSQDAEKIIIDPPPGLLEINAPKEA